MNKLDILKQAKLYLVTSREHSNYDTLDLIKIALENNIRLIQLREKTLSHSDLYYLAKEARALCDKHNSLLIINDYIDIMLAVKADGVHLGQNDLPLNVAKSLLNENYIIGVSTHSIEEVLVAQKNGATYINIGPIFSTNTKNLTNYLGIKQLEEILSFVKIPYTFMGGININNIRNLKKFRPNAFAMITEITKAENIGEKIKELFKLI